MIGAAITWYDDWYDGPVDGLVEHQGRELWFSVDRDAGWAALEERRFLVYELQPEELAHVRAVQLADAEKGQGGGPRERRALGGSWDDGEDGSIPAGRESIGWFVGKGAF